MTKKTSPLVLGALLVATPVLAGCFTGPGLDTMTLEELAVPIHMDTWNWSKPLLYDGVGGTLLEPPMDLSEWMPVGVEVEVRSGAAEPNIGVTSSGHVYVTVGDAIFKSVDKGKTWNITWELIGPLHPDSVDMWSNTDPGLWVDQDTDRVFMTHMHPAVYCLYMAWTDNDGEQWTERPFGCATPNLDHQKVMTAKPGPNAPPIPLQDYENLVYLCVNKAVFRVLTYTPGTWCGVSYDGGNTWAYDREVHPFDEECGNINGHPAAFPDGTVAFVLGNIVPWCTRPLTIYVTEDNGLTWEARHCGDESRLQKEIDADITVTPDGTAYLVFRDQDELVWLARSKDKFQTCDFFRVAPPNHTLNTFTAITSGDDGRIAIAYLGTTNPQQPKARPSNATPGTEWHAFVTTSFDADSENPTFLTQQITPLEDPVQVGCIWLHGGAGGPMRCRNLLDFIDMTRDNEGRWYVSITDGCTPRNGCGGRPEAESDFQSRDSKIAVLVQDRGQSLLKDKGNLPSIGLKHPNVFGW